MTRTGHALGRWLAAIRRLNTDQIAAQQGWTVEPGRFGTRRVRDPRFDTVRRWS